MSHVQTRPTQFLIASLALFAAAACVDSSGPGHIEDPGVLLVPAGKNGGDLIWTRDGTEVIYVSSTVTTADRPTNIDILNAVSVSTHAVRQLNVSPSILSVARGSAGERIYFAAYSGLESFLLSRVHPTSGALEILTSIPLGTSNNKIVVSADERFVAVESGLYDLQTATRMSLPAGQPIGFSPDGTQLLYYQDQVGISDQLPTLISTADGSSQPLHSTGYFYRAHRWEGNSPQLLKTDFDYTGGNSYTVRLSEIDGVTGVTRDIAQFSETNGLVDLSAGTWSPDGRTLGIWIEQGSIEKRTDRTTLYFIRAGSAPTIVASVHANPGRPVFSPDGNSVAYFYFNTDSTHSVYVRSGI
jgi:hypothetical protein